MEVSVGAKSLESDKFRIESDSMGEIQIPDDKYYGAQSARSLKNFAIGAEIFPPAFINALAQVKLAAAKTNAKLGKLDQEKCDAIGQAVMDILAGKIDLAEHFPLSVWQTGSGTQTNMNMNEVLANRAEQILGGKLGDKKLVHPNDDVNKSQSSNDVFPTAMHVAAVTQVYQSLIPMVTKLKEALEDKSKQFAKIVKIGRTHLMDATPVTVGQEFSGYVQQLEYALTRIKFALNDLSELQIGGTAVGTGLNTPAGYVDLVVKNISEVTGHKFTSAKNKFEALSAHDAMVQMSGTLKTLAGSLFKIANDVRWSGSGPRCGFAELILPANEPGSSIMPGKVNPTQCEAITMVAVQVMGNDACIGFAGASGNFQLNVYNPVMIFNLLQSIKLLSDACESFTDNCVVGLEVDLANIDKNLHNSLMLVTALNTHIGYDNAAVIAKKAYKEGTSLKQAALELELLTEQQFDEWVDPLKMVGEY